MTTPPDRPTIPGVADWQARLAGLGPATTARVFREGDASRASSAADDPGRSRAATIELNLRELFVHSRAGERAGSNVFCVLRLTRNRGRRAAPELVFVGAEKFAGHLASTADGVRVVDLQLSAAATGLVGLGLVVVRAPRTLRTQATLASLQGLSECLDFRRDPVGSDAVADSLTTRLESLLAIPGCAVVIAGRVDLTAAALAAGAHYFWLGAGAPAQLEREYDVADGRVVRRRTTRPDDIASRTFGMASDPDLHDYALLRVGPAPARPSPVRSLADLRRRHLFVGSEAGERTEADDDANSWSERARHSRVISDAERIMRAVNGGDGNAAREALHQALQRPDAPTDLGEQLSARARTHSLFWGVYDALQVDATAAPAPSDPAARTVVAESLVTSFAKLLGLDHVPGVDEIPVVTPTLMEIGDHLVPFVDSRQDDGLFLYELIPAMKDRIKADVGVAVPGVRVRGSGVADAGCVVMVGEANRFKTSVQPGAQVVVRRWPGGPPPPGGIVTIFHPINGARGVWLIQPAAPLGDADADDAGTDAESSEPVSTPQLLIHYLETVLRQSLPLYLGPQEVATLVDEWDKALDGLATTTAPDTAARVRLTWLLQALVGEQVPITQGELLLRTLHDAPASATPAELHRLLRFVLRAQLPGPRTGDLLVTLPPELEAGAAGREGSSQAVDFVKLQAWLRGIAAELGPAFSVVTSGHESRELVSTALTGLYPLVTTFCMPELEP